MRKVAANSPIQGSSSNANSNSCSNQTLMTSHVQPQRVVAESPPVIVSPAPNQFLAAQAGGAGLSKPGVARNLLGQPPTANPNSNNNNNNNNPSSNSNQNYNSNPATTTTTAAVRNTMFSCVFSCLKLSQIVDSHLTHSLEPPLVCFY
jgi:hypothetical protein